MTSHQYQNSQSHSKAPNSLKDKFGSIDLYQSYAILLTDSSRKILDVNSKFLDIFQYSNEEIIGQETKILNSGLHDTSYYEKMWHSLENDREFTSLINTKRKDGKIIRCNLRIVPQDKKDGTSCYLVMYDPINEEASFHLDAFESYKILTELIEKMPDIICIKDGDGRWLLANKANLMLFQLHGIKYYGKTDDELLKYNHKDFDETFLQSMRSDEECWQKKRSIRKDEKIPIPDWGEIIIETLRIPIFNTDGSRKNLILIGRDVSKRRITEQGLKKALSKAEESDRLKTAFLATMSHELRTPLNSVLGFSNLILMDDDFHEVHDYAQIINSHGQMLLNLIEDIFDISLIESNQMLVNKKETDIVKVIDEIFEVFPAEISSLNKTHISFTKKIPFDELLVITDGFRIKQIVSNLLRNALKFTTEGYISVDLEIEKEEIRISVEDSGIGIKEEKLNIIFDAFKQVEVGLSRKFGGAGLGLAIARRLAILLGGHLSATSEINKGSRFTLTIPNLQLKP